EGLHQTLSGAGVASRAIGNALDVGEGMTAAGARGAEATVRAEQSELGRAIDLDQRINTVRAEMKSDAAPQVEQPPAQQMTASDMDRLIATIRAEQAPSPQGRVDPAQREAQPREMASPAGGMASPAAVDPEAFEAPIESRAAVDQPPRPKPTMEPIE